MKAYYAFNPVFKEQQEELQKSKITDEKKVPKLQSDQPKHIAGSQSDNT